MRGTILAMLASLAVSGAASAAETCQQVSGTVDTSFTTEGCTSPVGLCTTGTVSAGALSGTTSFTASSVEMRGRVLFFTGSFTVTTSSGTVTYDTSGALNLVTDRYVETFTATSGASGHLFSTGFSTGTGFAGPIAGELCAP